MNEKPIMLGIPVGAALPQTAATDVAAPFLQDSQAFQGILQSITEVKEEGTKPVGVQQVLASLLPTGSAVFSDGVSIEPPKPEEKKGERENANAMSVMATALVTPPVVFQAIEAPMTKDNEESLESLDVLEESTSPDKTAFNGIPSLYSVSNEDQIQIPFDSGQVLEDETNTGMIEFSPVAGDNSVAIQTGPIQKETAANNSPILSVTLEQVHADLKIAGEGSEEILTEVGKIPLPKESTVVQSLRSGLEQQGTLSEDRVSQQKAGVLTAQSAKTTLETMDNLTPEIIQAQDVQQPLGVLVQSVSVLQSHASIGQKIPAVIEGAEASPVANPTMKDQRDLDLKTDGLGSQVENHNSGTEVPANSFKSDPANQQADISFSTQEQNTPIIITPVVTESQATAQVVKTGSMMPVGQGIPVAMVYDQAASGQTRPPETEGAEDYTDVADLNKDQQKTQPVSEKMYSRPIDPAQMTARQHARQIPVRDVKGGRLAGVGEQKVSLQMPEALQNDSQSAAAVNGSENLRFADLEEASSEKAAVPEKGKETTAVTEAKTSLPKPEVSVKEAVPVTPTGASTGSTDVLPASEPVTRTVKYEPREVVNQIVRGTHVMVRDGATQMQIRLDPPELGKVELKIIAEQDGIKAHFVTESQTVKALIETQLPHLRNALQQAGLQADTLSVSVGGRWTQGGNSGSAFSGRENQSFYTPNHRYAENADEDIQYRESEAAASSWLGRINLKA